MANEAPERTLSDVIATIEAGEFYRDYDRSSADLRILRATPSSDAVAGGEAADDEKPRYTTKRLRHEIERARENDARELAKLLEKVKELEKVLEPFAKIADQEDRLLTRSGESVFVNVDILRTARRVREGGKADG